MAVMNPPVWMQAGTYTAEHDRLISGLLFDRKIGAPVADTASGGALISAPVSKPSNSSVGFGGVVPPNNQLRVTTANGGDMVVTVSPGIAVVPRESATPPGVYICYNETPTSITVPTCASGIRTDLLVARVNDSLQSDAGDNWELVLLPGASGDEPPAYSGSVVPLAKITVRAAADQGGTDKITHGQISDLRTYVSGAGGVHLFWGGNPLSALVSPGRLAYDVVNDTFWLSTSTSWEPLYNRKYMERYRARDKDYNTLVKIGTANAWKYTISIVDPAGTMPDPIKVINRSPCGQFKVTLSGLGKCDSGNVDARVSVQARTTVGNTEIMAPNFNRSILFYSQTWIYSSTTFIADLGALGTGVDVDFRVAFYKSKEHADDIQFNRIMLVVDPIL